VEPGVLSVKFVVLQASMNVTPDELALETTSSLYPCEAVVIDCAPVPSKVTVDAA